MKKLLTAAQAREADRYTCEQIGIPSMVLMETASMAVRDSVLHFLQQGRAADELSHSRVLAVCGSGNNGGDGAAAARLLLMKGIHAEVFFAGNEEHGTEQMKAQLSIFEKLGGKVYRQVPPDFGTYDVLIDALLGIGLSRPVEGKTALWIDRINEASRKDKVHVISVDIPSGVCADNGKTGGVCVHADETVTFSYLKRGHIQYPGRENCGVVHLCEASICMEPASGSKGADREDACAFTLDTEDVKRLLPKRVRRSNKGTYGRAVIAAGCRNMAGAAVLCGRAAMNTGVGLVQFLSDETNRVILQSSVPEAVYTPVLRTTEYKNILSKASAVGIGPGLGTSAGAAFLLKRVLENRGGKTLVIDADALNLLSENGRKFSGEEDLAEEPADPVRSGVIITPHPGEMSRLTGLGVPAILDDPVRAAMTYAKQNNLICVLKDASTIVTDGRRLYINQSGCGGMSTAGSGDVLTGIITALAAQGLDAFTAAYLGVYIHGLAGERASSQWGERGMTAMDIVEAVKWVLREYAQESI